MKGMDDREFRGAVMYVAGWVVGYVVACVFYIFITQNSGYTMAKYIDKFTLLGAAYLLVYSLGIWLFLFFFDDWFEKNKLGWIKKAYLSVAVVGVLVPILVSLFGFFRFPFNLFGNNFLSVLSAVWALIAWPISVGLFIVFLFAEALGVEYS